MTEGRYSAGKDFTLHCTALHCTALHCTALHCTALHYTALHCTTLHCTALHFTALHCTALNCTSLHCTALHCTALHLSSMCHPDCIPPHCTVSQIALHRQDIQIETILSKNSRASVDVELCPLVQEYRARMQEYRTSSLPMAIECDPRMEAEARNNFQVTETFTAVQCSAVQYRAVQCSAQLYSAVQCRAVQ